MAAARGRIHGQVFGDSINLLHASIGDSHLGSIVDSARGPTSSLLMSMAMWLAPGLADPLVPRKPPGFLLPGLTAGAGLIVLFVRTLAPVNRVATALATAALLLVVLRTWLSVRQLRAQTRIRQRQSVTDHLTQLANRRHLFDALDVCFAAPAAERPKLAFCSSTSTDSSGSTIPSVIRSATSCSSRSARGLPPRCARRTSSPASAAMSSRRC